MNKRILLTAVLLSGCSMAPDFTMPDMHAPDSFKEEQAELKGQWQAGQPLDTQDRGQWWKIFGDEQLNALEQQAADANVTLKVAAARAAEARATAKSYVPSLLPDLDIGANAVRAQPAGAELAAFGSPTNTKLRPYTLYNAQGVLSYQADLFGQVRDNYKAFQLDAQAAGAAYRNALLAVQADVAQHYFALRTLDAQTKLLRDELGVRQEAARIMQRRFELGDAAAQDQARTQSELESVNADLIAVQRQRAISEHALAVLLGKLPSEFSFAETPLDAVPPAIPAGLPSTLLERRPDVAAAQASMAAANARIGVARTAFFPVLNLTASGGYESTSLGDLFLWSNRTWALGQLANTALSMPIFDSGRNMARLHFAHAQYDESVAAYRRQVLVAFRDVEDNLSGQRLLAGQSTALENAASAATRTTDLTRKRYDAGDANYFEVVDAERISLAAERAALDVRGQRFIATVALVAALGGDFSAPAAAATPAEAQKPQ